MITTHFLTLHPCTILATELNLRIQCRLHRMCDALLRTFQVKIWTQSSMAGLKALLHWNDRVGRHLEKLRNRSEWIDWKCGLEASWLGSLHRCIKLRCTLWESKCATSCMLNQTSLAFPCHFPQFPSLFCHFPERLLSVGPFWWRGLEFYRAEL